MDAICGYVDNCVENIIIKHLVYSVCSSEIENVSQALSMKCRNITGIKLLVTSNRDVKIVPTTPVSISSSHMTLLKDIRTYIHLSFLFEAEYHILRCCSLVRFYFFLYFFAHKRRNECVKAKYKCQTVCN